MKRSILLIISLYQELFPVRGNCRFYPTCSNYTKEAINMHGLLRGLMMGARRVSRCNPVGGQGIDFVQRGNI